MKWDSNEMKEQGIDQDEANSKIGIRCYDRFNV